MKKIISIICCLTIVLGISACSKDETSSKQDNQSSQTITDEDKQNNSEEFDNVKASEEFAVQMASGDFSNTYQTFSAKLKLSLTEDSLKTAWDTTVKSIGDYVEYDKTETTKQGNSEIVTCYLKYSQKGLIVQLTFNSDNQLDGLWLNYYTPTSEPKLESSEDFTETAIKVGELKVHGILTMPKDKENPPVVILVQGSGQSDMNETIGEGNNQPFRDIAHGLAEHGIATIRYNKRYYQYAEKATTEITIEGEIIDDVNSAIELASNNQTLDSNKIFVLGHSLGGMVAPKIAYDNSSVAGIISLAGSPRNLEDIMLDQINASDEVKSLSEEEKEDHISKIEESINKIKTVTKDDSDAILNISAKYWYSLNNVKQDECAKELEIPMLFLQGDNDFQVYVDKDFEQWKNLLSGKDNCTFKLYEGLNHIFMKSNGLTDVTEYNNPDNVDSQVINDISDWIHSN